MSVCVSLSMCLQNSLLTCTASAHLARIMHCRTLPRTSRRNSTKSTTRHGTASWDETSAHTSHTRRSTSSTSTSARLQFSSSSQVENFPLGPAPLRSLSQQRTHIFTHHTSTPTLPPSRVVTIHPYNTTQHTHTHHITSHHITSHHITSHHITSHHITSHHITSHKYPKYNCA
jgi:hypothetical protein